MVIDPTTMGKLNESNFFFLVQINVRTLLALTNVCAPRDSLTIQ